MFNEELKKKIVETTISTVWKDCYGDEVVIDRVAAEQLAEALIAAGIGDVKEIKYRVRRAEKALYIACRETAKIIFKDDFDRHAQEYMYGYLIQAEKELTEEGKDD